QRPRHRAGLLPAQQPVQARRVAVAAGASRQPVPAAGHRRGRDSTAPVHLRAPLSGLVRDRGHAAPAVAAALRQRCAVLPRRRGREVDPPSYSAAVTTGPFDGESRSVTGSVALRHEVPSLERGLIVIRALRRARGNLHLLAWDLLVRDELEQVTDAVETRAP